MFAKVQKTVLQIVHSIPIKKKTVSKKHIGDK